MNTPNQAENLVDRLAMAGLEPGEPIRESRAIAASTQSVWSAISKAGNLSSYHPFCKANPVHKWPGAGARDEVIYFSGLVYHRDFTDWLEGVGYDLEIGPNPRVKSARVSWRIEAKENATAVLTIEVTPYLKKGIPDDRKQAYLDKAFGNVMASYLDSVVKGVDAFVTSGRAVREDQFGRHPLYSAACDPEGA